MKGLERKNLEKGVPQSPTGEERRTIEQRIIESEFGTNAERLAALAVVRSIFRYNSSSAKFAHDKLSSEGKSKLDEILSEIGFKLDFSEKSDSSPKLTRRRPNLKIVD